MRRQADACHPHAQGARRPHRERSRRRHRKPTDAIIRVTRACICGSDLWPYNDWPDTRGPAHGPRGDRRRRGRRHATSSAIKRGEVVIMPFAFSDGTCAFCHEGLHTACVHGGFFGNGTGLDGAQAEALRVPHADGTLYPLPRGRGRRADAVAAHAVGRDGHRPPRGRHRAGAARRAASRSSATARSGCAA